LGSSARWTTTRAGRVLRAQFTARL